MDSGKAATAIIPYACDRSGVMRASEPIGRRIELDPPRSQANIWNLPKELFDVGFDFNDANRKFDKTLHREDIAEKPPLRLQPSFDLSRSIPLPSLLFSRGII